MQVGHSNGKLIIHRGTDQMSSYINESQVFHCKKRNVNIEKKKIQDEPYGTDSGIKMHQ